MRGGYISYEELAKHNRKVSKNSRTVPYRRISNVLVSRAKIKTRFCIASETYVPLQFSDTRVESLTVELSRFYG